jgi:flagellar L-ring protein precursor FlgH
MNADVFRNYEDRCMTRFDSGRPPADAPRVWRRSALISGLALGLSGSLLRGGLAEEGPNSSLYSGRLAAWRAAMATAASPATSATPGPQAAGQPLSWYEIPLPPPKEVRVHDIVTIRVDTGARVSESAQLQRRRTSQYDAILNDWIQLVGLRAVKPSPQSDGDPRVQGNLNQLNRVTGQLDTTESLKFEIAATVAAILPNGNIVLEAHREVINNNEKWLHSLSGTCRREDIGPNNVVLSKDIANLRIEKRELGQIRDAYRRGWLTRWWDQFGPF